MKYDRGCEPSLLGIGLLAAVVMLLAFWMLVSGCATPSPLPSVDVPERISLSWETKSERAAWSDHLIGRIKLFKSTYDKAGDVTKICPKYKSMSERDQLNALGEFWVALAYYESSFNPASSSVDVGKPGKKDTYSAGLYQVSVVDQEWSGGDLSYSFEQLLTAKPNIDLATQLMKRQIEKAGEFILPNASKYRYWAVILEGNKYSKIPEIIARVKKNVPICQ